MTNTDSEIKSIKSRTSSLETTMGTKVDTSTFNELSQTVDENRSSITSLSQTVSGKADSGTVSTLSNTVNTISQKTDANTSSISSLTTTVSGKADASNVYTKTETDSRISVVQQDLTGFKTTVSNTYTTNDQMSALTQRVTSAESSIEQNATNITTKVSKTDFTGQNVMSMINQDASSVTISASKVNLNGAVSFSSFDSALQDQVTGISNTATSAQSTANTANNTANSAYAHTRMLDTRYDDQPPSWYTAKTSGIYNEFKLCSTIGISTTATYCYLTTFVPWQGLSGGLPVQEATFSESDAVYRRYATSASEWSAWKSTSKILAGWQYSDTTYIDGGNIYTGTITAGKITVGELSDLADDMGTITAGVLQSHNYVADTSGMKLTLSNGVWDSKDFKISSTGAITSTAGTIGGWTINNNMLESSVDGEIISWISLDSENARINMSRIGGGGTRRMNIASDSISQFYQASSGSNETRTVDLHYPGLHIASDYPNQYRASTDLEDGNIEFTYSSLGEGSDYTASYTYDSIHLKDVTHSDEFEFDFSNGLRIKNGNNYVFTADTSGNLAVGGNITSNNKNVVVDNYASGFMGFTTATVTKTVNSGTGSMTNLTYVDLTPGVYAVECTAEWDSNSTIGYRHLCLSTSSTGGAVDRFAAVTGPAGPAYDRQGFVRLFHLTSNTRFYLNAQQTSGGPINTLGGIQALRLGNN